MKLEVYQPNRSNQPIRYHRLDSLILLNLMFDELLLLVWFKYFINFYKLLFNFNFNFLKICHFFIFYFYKINLHLIWYNIEIHLSNIN